MKLQQQTTIRQPLHHWDSDDDFGLSRFVELIIAMLVFLTVTTAEISADERVQDESSSEAAKTTVARSAQTAADSPGPFDGNWKLHAVSNDRGRNPRANIPTIMGVDQTIPSINQPEIKSGKLIYQDPSGGLGSEELTLIHDDGTRRFTSKLIGSGTVQQFGDILFLNVQKPTNLAKTLEFWRAPQTEKLQTKHQELEKQLRQLEGEGLLDAARDLKAKLESLQQRIRLGETRHELEMQIRSFRVRADLKRQSGETEWVTMLLAAADKYQNKLDSQPTKTLSEIGGSVLHWAKAGDPVKPGQRVQFFTEQVLPDGLTARQIIAESVEVYSGITDDGEHIGVLFTRADSSRIDSVDPSAIQYCVVKEDQSVQARSEEPPASPTTAREQIVPMDPAPISTESEDTQNAAASEFALPLLAGDWKLQSMETLPQNSSLQWGSVSGRIHGGKLVMNGETVELEVVTASEFRAEVKLKGPTGAPARAIIDRFGDVIRITSKVMPEPREPQAENQSDVAIAPEAAEASPESIVLEFWKVDPSRSKTVQALRDLQLQVNTLRLEGRQEDMAAVGMKIADLTNSLKRMDMSPQITSLSQQALQAREKGDHGSADKLEFEAGKLSKQLFAETNAANQIEVFVATMKIEPGDLLNRSNSKLVAVDATSMPEGAVTNPAEVWGQFSSTRRSPGDWILSQQLQPDSRDTGSSIPPGYRVITIPIDATLNHTDLLQPGNRIDLLLTFQVRDPNSGQQTGQVTPLLENIEVFAVDAATDANTDSVQTRNISLLVKPQQAMKVQLAREKGSISTALRSREDTDMVGDVTMEEPDLLTDDSDKPGPFDGEWRLDSIEPESLLKEIVEDDPTIRDFEQLKSLIWIRNGTLKFDADEPIDLQKSADQISGDKWEISLPGNSPGKCWARRFGNVLRLDFTGTGTDLVYEFFQVSPDRKDVTRQLIDLNSQLSASRAAGDARNSKEIDAGISRLNARLQQLDAQPMVDSLTFMAIRAREKGDHRSAQQYEIDARELADQLHQFVPAEATARSSGAVNQATKRSALEEEKQALLSACESCEADTVSLAKEYRAAVAALSPENSQKAAAEQQELTALEIQLKRSVALAFETQSKLQGVKLQLAELDLAEIRARHERRSGLARQIIERRVADLMSGEDLEWSQAKSTSKNTSPLQQANTPLTGAWYGTVEGTIGQALSGPVFVTITDDKFVIEPGGVRGTIALTDSANCKIALNFEGIPGPKLTGEFRRDADRLVINCNSLIARLTLKLQLAPTATEQSRPIKLTQSVPTFATPQELVDFVNSINADESQYGPATMELLFDLATDDEIKRFSGLMLRTTSMMQMVAGLGAAFGNSDGPDGNDERQQMAAFLQAVGRMNLIVDKYRHKNPAPEALAAFQEIAGGLNLSMIFRNALPTAAIGADEYSQKLRLAAGVLDDPKLFVLELLKEMQSLEATQASADGGVSGSKVKPQWEVTVNGDTAHAVNVSAKPETSNTLNLTGTTQSMDLVRVGDTWKISSLIPDRVIIEMQQGLTVTESSAPANTQPVAPLSYQPQSTLVPASTYAAPVGVKSAIATQTLKPFTELTPNNVSVSQVFADSDRQNAISLSDVQGRYINRPLEGGQLITSDMLIDKPSTEQIVNFWLDEGKNRRVVFQNAYQYLTGEPEFANPIPYDAQHSAEVFNDGLPKWTDTFLQSVQQRLESRPMEKWTGELTALLWSVSDVIFFQRASDNRNLKPIGTIVGQFVSVDNEGLSKISAPDVRRAAHSGLILGEAVRLNGALPASVLELQPTERVIDRKLKLLQQMVNNEADSTWINQEQIRLAGLLDEAPVQALKLLLTTARIKSHSDLEHWVFAMSSDTTYRAWRLSPQKDFAPPVDPVVVIAVAELLAGRSQLTDDNLALLFDSKHPGYMFYRHTRDLVAGELNYRDSVLKMLVSIYSKSKSPRLNTNLAKMAPSVTVQAEK